MSSMLLTLPHPAPAAAFFACAAHEAIRHERKFTGESYTTHLATVAGLVWASTQDPVVTAAAWLHDVLEDTPVPRHTLLQLFGPEVTRMVDALTEPSGAAVEGLHRVERKRLYRHQIAIAGPSVHTIKAADMLSNLSTCHLFRPEFYRVYLQEQQSMLTVIPMAERDLYERASHALALHLSTL